MPSKLAAACATLAIAVSALVAGCVVAPPRVDPFAGLTVTNAAYRELTIALLPSQNTANSLRYTNELSARGADATGTKVFQDHRGPMGEAADKTFVQAVDLFKKQFKAVIKIDRPGDALGVGADAVLLLDIAMDLPHVRAFPPGTTDAKIDIGAVFLEPEGRQIEAITASSVKTPGFPRTAGKITASVVDARDEALGRFAQALLSSPKLAEFAGRKVPAAAAAAKQPAASPSRRWSSTVDRPTYRAPEQPDNFAVVVGIEKYNGLPDAQFAQRDAEAVREHLLAMGYPERNVVLLTGQAASSAGLKKHVESWLPNNVSEKSTVFFYYSGHGAPDPKSGQAYLVPTDGDPQYLEDTAYPIQRLYQKLEQLPAKRVIVAMDSCFSGAGGRSVIAKGIRPLVTKMELGRITAKRLLAFSASSGEQVSGAAEDEGHGLFTYYFLNGLNERRGKTTAKALYEYLKPKVQDRARRANREQTPQLLVAAPDVDAALQ